MKIKDVDYTNLPRCNGKSQYTYEQFERLWNEKILKAAVKMMRDKAIEEHELEIEKEAHYGNEL